KKKKNALKQVEVSLLVTEIDKLHKEWTAILATLEHDKDLKTSEQTKIQEKEMQLEQNRHTIQKMDENISALQNKLLHITEMLKKTERKKNDWEEHSNQRVENKEKLEMQQKDKETHIHQLEIKRQEEERELKAIQKEMEICISKMSELQDCLS